MAAFGEFVDICNTSATLAVCSVFPERDEAQKVCQLGGVDVGTLKITDVGNLAATVLAMVATIYVGFLVHSKYAAVGRREMILLFFIYFTTLLSQVMALTGWRTSTMQLDDPFTVWTGAVNMGFVAGLSWILLMNGFVGFQMIEDGSWISMLSIFGSAFLLFIATVFIGVDTAYNLTGIFVYETGSMANIPLFVLTLILPLVAVVLYAILVTILVMRTLSQRKPLAFVLGAVVMWGVGQVFTFLISTPICSGTSGAIDGNMFNTVLTFVAFYMVFYFWSSITEDGWDDFEDHF